MTIKNNNQQTDTHRTTMNQMTLRNNNQQNDPHQNDIQQNEPMLHMRLSIAKRHSAKCCGSLNNPFLMDISQQTTITVIHCL